MDVLREREVRPRRTRTIRESLHQEAPVLQHPNELLCIKRVAAGAFNDRCLDLGRDGWLIEQVQTRRAVSSSDRGDSPIIDGVAEILGSSLHVVGQLRTGGADHEHGCALGPIGEVLQECQAAPVRPVEIFEHEDRWIGAGDAFEEPSPRGERFLPFSRGGPPRPRQVEQVVRGTNRVFELANAWARRARSSFETA